MSILRQGDTIFIKVARKINGKRVIERVEIDAWDVRYLSTPMLLRKFVEQIDRATARLDAAEEYAAEAKAETLKAES